MLRSPSLAKSHFSPLAISNSGVDELQDSNNLTRDLGDRFERVLNAAREGEQHQLGCLLEFYRDYLITFATKRLSRQLALKSSPSDLVQETLMKASSEFRRFSGVSETELQLWLRKILRRKLIDSYRFYQVSKTRDITREVPLPPEALPGSSGGELESSELRSVNTNLLLNVLDRLDRIQQQVIQLRTFERKSFEEIGRQLGRSSEAARKLWTRAILQLTKEFRAHESRTQIGR